MSKQFNVVGIGNAMVDILARCDDAFLSDAGIEKGIMQLIDMPRAIDLYSKIGPAQEVSGGSAANTIAVIAALGGTPHMSARSRTISLGQSLHMICAHKARSTRPHWPQRLPKTKLDAASFL